MRLTTLIADDEFHAVENLKRLIVRCCPALDVVASAYSLQEAKALAARHNPQVVFLDIKMPGGNTIDNISSEAFGNAQIVFVTAYDEFALKAIKLGALDYILKPVHPDELVAAAGKLVARYSMQPAGKNAEKPAVLGVYVNGEYEMIPCSDIITLEASGAYTRIYTCSQKILTSSKNIGYYSLLLDKTDFCRVHKSYLVNVSKIVSVNKAQRTLKMSGSQSVPVSVRMLAGLSSRINK